jgi:hypothetical protein
MGDVRSLGAEMSISSLPVRLIGDHFEKEDAYEVHAADPSAHPYRIIVPIKARISTTPSSLARLEAGTR